MRKAVAAVEELAWAVAVAGRWPAAGVVASAAAWAAAVAFAAVWVGVAAE